MSVGYQIHFSIFSLPDLIGCVAFHWLLPDLAFTSNGQPLEGRTTNPKGYSGIQGNATW